MRLCNYCQAGMAVLPTLKIGQYIFCGEECAAAQIAALEDKAAVAEQVYADLKGRLSSAMDLLSPGASNHTSGCSDPDMDVWEFSNRTQAGDSVAIKTWNEQRGTHFCADITKITKVTPLRIEIAASNTGHPVQYWRKHGEAVGNRSVRAARPGHFDWEIYRERQGKTKVAINLPLAMSDDDYSDDLKPF